MAREQIAWKMNEEEIENLKTKANSPWWVIFIYL